MLEHNRQVDSIDVNTEISKCLSTYLYKNVNCLPYSEYRHNIRITPIYTSPKSNIVRLANMSI